METLKESGYKQIFSWLLVVLYPLMHVNGAPGNMSVAYKHVLITWTLDISAQYI